MENIKSLLMIIAIIIGCVLLIIISPLIQGLISLILIMGVPMFILYIIVKLFQNEPPKDK